MAARTPPTPADGKTTSQERKIPREETSTTIEEAEDSREGEAEEEGTLGKEAAEDPTRAKTPSSIEQPTAQCSQLPQPTS